MRKNLFLILFLLVIAGFIGSKELSLGFKDFKLNQTQSEVKELIKKSFDFANRRDEAISIRLEPDTDIITAEGLGFIKIGYFHFNKDKLFQIFLKLDEKRLGYYLILKRFTEKFGNPTSLEPKSAFWENEEVKIIIEKPCSLKYIYKPIWNEITAADQTTDSVFFNIREKFIDDL
ncbi:MAG TPA: hypothetical protein PK385_03785 [Spirochaetota bacterium]|nr:hypothetical protein [Spirochaetota bacterium]HOS31934.1 hypothetical protein [Spirochaetota bacterium]HOS55159.1 hypothetical protein [Spirochaetota bacterium]HPK61045.1 hypothetical protein [Spirochaetota bacterium]HQF77014.1 hypothetical protein [Spirochaetota bacterium]